ncbi:MAG: hypothetical protein Q7Q71_07930 [Verrucomicrobiota bacterium JB023]|nr:hypothetical protein [Verrucomicrobiota bacterium JB023]
MAGEPLSGPVIWGCDDELLSAKALGVDLEADSLFRYRERICLIQLTDGSHSVLVDPLDEDVSDLASALLSREVWMHGADYDMALMKREWGGVPSRICDTQIGARLLGSRRFGYANLVEDYFGVTLSKSSQKADWGKRPLPSKMAEYALNDVRYLMPLAEAILERLEDKGRLDWFLESCHWERERALSRPGEREDAWRIRGSGKFDRRTLAYLQAFWNWREEEAEAWDRPSFMVAGNKDLLEWCQLASQGKRFQLPNSMRTDRRRRLFEKIEKLKQSAESDWPQRVFSERKKRDREKEKRVDELLARRDQIAEELELEPSVVASRGLMEAYVQGETDRLMSWQREVMGLDVP